MEIFLFFTGSGCGFFPPYPQYMQKTVYSSRKQNLPFLKSFEIQKKKKYSIFSTALWGYAQLQNLYLKRGSITGRCDPLIFNQLNLKYMHCNNTKQHNIQPRCGFQGQDFQLKISPFSLLKQHFQHRYQSCYNIFNTLNDWIFRHRAQKPKEDSGRPGVGRQEVTAGILSDLSILKMCTRIKRTRGGHLKSNT